MTPAGPTLQSSGCSQVSPARSVQSPDGQTLGIYRKRSVLPQQRGTFWTVPYSQLPQPQLCCVAGRTGHRRVPRVSPSTPKWLTCTLMNRPSLQHGRCRQTSAGLGGQNEDGRGTQLAAPLTVRVQPQCPARPVPGSTGPSSSLWPCPGATGTLHEGPLRNGRLTLEDFVVKRAPTTSSCRNARGSCLKPAGKSWAPSTPSTSRGLTAPRKRERLLRPLLPTDRSRGVYTA